MDRCDECGYAFDVDVAELPGRLTAAAAAIGERLTTAALTAVTRRPAPGSWSALELACHVRDVFLVQRERIVRVLVEDRPSFPPMHRDERAVLERYSEQTPTGVAAEVSVAARLLAGVLTGRSAADLDRPCIYNYPEPAYLRVFFLGIIALQVGVHNIN
jgi:hypothetical protein